MTKRFSGFLLLVLTFIFKAGIAQINIIHKDSIVYHFVYRDTVIYRYDTVQIRHYVHTDTLEHINHPVAATEQGRKKRLINQNNWGIGPSVGAYYSPFNGFDLNIGFGIQYYLLSVPSFRNPHLGHRKNKK
ncbi:MAG TPA: hypothetical protein VIM65_08505 [Cyclobacteriaceae bacterium]